MAELYLVEFKGSRKEYFLNRYYHSLQLSDFVIIQAERGEDIGRVLKKIDSELKFDESNNPRSILRRASEEDIIRRKEFEERERQCRTEIIELIKDHRLEMKVVDIEWQFDGNKMTIFFTADHRVDFRELVKTLASRYRTRIELRQIGVRDEARRIGGYGVCGLMQCCNSFLKEFEPVSTQHAREQDLPLNPSKISGNCGRLLCCLRYEVEEYTRVKKRFPKAGSFVRTKSGDGDIVRIDVFNEEAVIRGSEGILFRVSDKDILERDRSSDRHPRKPSIATAGDNDTEDNTDVRTRREELRKLDDNKN